MPFKKVKLGASTIIASTDIHKNAGNKLFMNFWKLTKLAKLVNPQKTFFQHFYEYL
jgi:hypothetical protein